MTMRAVKVFIAGLAITSVLLAASATLLLSTGPTATSNCQAIEAIKSRIRTSVGLSLKQLGQPGSAGYAYYRVHPLELASAIAASKLALTQFKASPC